MSDNFNENLSMSLTSCRESAIQKLAKSNAEYKQLQSNAAEISKKIKNEIPCEHEALIDNFADAIPVYC